MFLAKMCVGGIVYCTSLYCILSCLPSTFLEEGGGYVYVALFSSSLLVVEIYIGGSSK